MTHEPSLIFKLPEDWGHVLTNQKLDHLSKYGFCEIPDLLDKKTVVQIRDYYLNRPLRQAGLTKQLEKSIRNDQIYWLEAEDIVDQQYLKWLQKLSQALNQLFFSGLNYVEAHFATYPSNSFYKPHIDNPKGSKARVFSCVFYLNDSWQNSDGGKLKIWDMNNEPQTITPIGGKLVLFDSSLLHEVEVAYASRHSITSWLRRELPPF